MILQYRKNLDEIYRTWTRPEYLSPDPLECVRHYPHVADREIAGLIAACLAFGNVRQIVRSVQTVLDRFPSPRQELMTVAPSRWRRWFRHWRHRFVGVDELCHLLAGMREAVRRYGSLEACFCAGYALSDGDVRPALTRFVGELRRGTKTYLLPSPEDGSACKRLNLFLRWMVRRDAVDPGGWTCVPPSKLLIPLDTHMHRLALRLRLSSRRQANMRTVLEVTREFRRIAPRDPVCYDFALTRLGINEVVGYLD